MARGKADFAPATKRLLANRVGWRCSVPGCKVGTIGPGAAEDESALTGVAAHIYSASSGGPRGRGSRSDDELSAPENGIWCCENHGKEIDTNSGRGYSVETLKSWKKTAEEAARRARSGVSPTVGWIDEVVILNNPLFVPGAAITFEKGVVIQSDRPAGKTALFEWLATFAGEDHTDRWRVKGDDEIRLNLSYSSPLPHRVEFILTGDAITYFLDGNVRHTPPSDIAILFLRDGDRIRRQLDDHTMDDLEYVSQALGVEATTTRSLIKEIDRNGLAQFHGMKFIEEERSEWYPDDKNQQPYVALSVPRNHPDTFTGSIPGRLYFAALAHSEQIELLIEFAAALGRERAQQMPTLLMLDGSGWPFSDAYLAVIAQRLIRQPFQIALTLDDRSFRDERAWESWGRIFYKREKQLTRVA